MERQGVHLRVRYGLAGRVLYLIRLGFDAQSGGDTRITYQVDNSLKGTQRLAARVPGKTMHQRIAPIPVGTRLRGRPVTTPTLIERHRHRRILLNNRGLEFQMASHRESRTQKPKDGDLIYVSVLGGSYISGPLFHQKPAFSQQITAGIGPLHSRTDLVRQRQFHDGMGRIRALAGPVTE